VATGRPEHGYSCRNRAAEAGLQSVDDLTGCALVVSVVPPSAAVETATSIAGFAGHVVDANAISPVTADEVGRIVTDGGAILAESRRATTSSRYSGDGLSASRIPSSSA
jgi:hypothetical protein